MIQVLSIYTARGAIYAFILELHLPDTTYSKVLKINNLYQHIVKTNNKLLC